MTTILSETRPGAYYDSVVLMQLQRAISGLPGIEDAGVVMATPANCELLAASELLVGTEAGSNDLLIVVKADSDSSARSALNQIDALLARRRSTAIQQFRTRSLKAAAAQLSDAQWVLVSVPGRYAADVARQALKLGRHVFLYSDNVALEDEVDLKHEAREAGLLLMGPDCGTAIINGVGLGFANRVRRGPIGVVGAAGTGIQAITAAIHNLGSGVSSAIGTGGRDLRVEVGAVTAYQGLDLLARDPDTDVIVLVSKPPSSKVAAAILGHAQTLGKPVVVDFVGLPPPSRRIGTLHFATSLIEAAQLAVDLHDNARMRDSSPVTGRIPDAELNQPQYLRGLFSGGTLAYEALLGLQTMLSPIYSNAPFRDSQRLPTMTQSLAHTILDLGADEFTQGRLHPMMDNDLRLRRLRAEAADPEVALVLLDVVLGEGAHPDPAGELAPAIAEARALRPIDFVAILVGTEEDPQDVQSQQESLEAAGTIVFRSTTEAVEFVIRRLAKANGTERWPRVSLELFKQPLAAINVGIEAFFESLNAQGAMVVQVDWRPPAGGDERLMALLAKMK